MRKAILAVAATATLLLAACGDDSGDDATAENPPSETVAANGGGSSSTSAGGATTTADEGGSGSGKGSDEPFCNFDEEMGSSLESLGGLISGTTSPDDVESAVDSLYDELDGLGDKFDDVKGDAPKEIKGDVDTVVDAFQQALGDLPDKDQLVDALKDAKTPEAAQEALTPLLDKFSTLEDDPKISKADDNIQAWVDANC